MSEVEPGSWKISRRRVDAIDNGKEVWLRYQNLIVNGLGRVMMDCRSSRTDVVVVGDYAAVAVEQSLR